jgi:hypothetical protein
VQQIHRRKIFKLVAVGSVVAAGAALPIVGIPAPDRPDQVGIRARVGLPEPPLPSYATYMIEGTLNLAKGSGVLVSRVLAGHPDSEGEIGLPGLSRVIRVLNVASRGSLITVHGVVEDRSQLQPGESPELEIAIDRQKGIMQAPFGGRSVTLTLV